MNKQNTNLALDKILLILIFCFPLIIVLRSAMINIATTVISFIMLFYILKRIPMNFFKKRSCGISFGK